MEASKLAVFVIASFAFAASIFSATSNCDVYASMGPRAKYTIMSVSFSLLIGALTVIYSF